MTDYSHLRQQLIMLHSSADQSNLFRKFTSKIREIPAQIGKLIKANLSLLVQLLVKVLYCCVCLLCDSMSGLPENL